MKTTPEKDNNFTDGVAFEDPMLQEEELALFKDVSWDLRRLVDENGEYEDHYDENEPIPSAGLTDAGTVYWDRHFGSSDADEDDPEDHTPRTDAVSPETAAALIAHHDPDEREILRIGDLGDNAADRLGGLFIGMTKKEITEDREIVDNDTDPVGERLLLLIKDGIFPDNTSV